jgi:hypothetical protein
MPVWLRQIGINQGSPYNLRKTCWNYQFNPREPPVAFTPGTTIIIFAESELAKMSQFIGI